MLCKLLVKYSILSTLFPIFLPLFLEFRFLIFLGKHAFTLYYIITFLNSGIKDCNHIFFCFQGAHIAVRDQKFALAVESCLKSTGYAFCCHDNHDQRLLLQLLRQCTDKVPSIIVSRFLVC